MAEKRMRSVNWESEEKQLLKEVMRQYIPVMNSKNNDHVVNKKKAQAWKEITEKFNNLNFRPRDVKQIYNQWKTMKNKSKKEMGEYNRQSRMTGGGPKPSSPSQETLEMVSMDPAGFSYPQSPFDSDNFVVVQCCESQVETLDVNVFALGRSDAAVASTSGTSVAAGGVRSECASVSAVSATVPAGAGCNIATPPATAASDGEAVAAAAASAPLPSPTISASATPRFRRGQTIGEDCNFKKKSFESMELYRKKEDMRLEREHNLRVQWSKEQHEQIMRLLSLQEQILLKELKK